MSATAKKSVATPIEALKQKISAEQRALDALQAQAVELQAERQSALLADGDEELELAEAAIVASLRKAERHKARRDALLVELEAAEAEQRHQEALADYARAAERVAQAELWQAVEYPKLAAALAEGLAMLQAVDRLVERVNAELPDGCAPLRAPSNARHVALEPDRRETRTVHRWVDATGRDLGAVQVIAGQPTVHGARMVEREEVVELPGRKPWWPAPLYQEVALPALERGMPDFWRA